MTIGAAWRADLRRAMRWLVAVIALAIAVPAFADPTYPQLTGRVVDDAHILQPAEVDALTAKLANLETQSQRQIVVATVPSLGGNEIEEYANGLFRAWHLGDKQRNDGLLLLIAPTEHKARIEVGRGLEGIVTDALSSMIIRHDIAPHFKADDYAGGINAATDELVAQLKLPDDQARAVAARAGDQVRREQQPHFDMGTVVFLIIFALFFVLPFIRSMSGGGRRYGGGVSVFPMFLGGFGGGSGWGGGGGGSDSGGGFSGGGGDSGGGGASGGW